MDGNTDAVNTEELFLEVKNSAVMGGNGVRGLILSGRPWVITV